MGRHLRAVLRILPAVSRLIAEMGCHLFPQPACLVQQTFMHPERPGRRGAAGFGQRRLQFLRGPHLAISGSRPQDGIHKRHVSVLDAARTPRTPIGDAPDMEEAAEERGGEEAVRTVGSHKSVDWTTRRGV